MPFQKPTIVLVQGSFQIKEVYSKLVNALEARQYPVVHSQLPTLTGHDEPDFASKDLQTDAAAIQNVLKHLIEDEGRRVVLLMHSYGGLVGNEAAVEELTWAKRSSLDLPGGIIYAFYVAAFVLTKGQSVLGTFGESPNNDVKPNGRFTMKNAAKVIYNDLPAAEAEKWESKMIDQSYAVQTTELTNETYKNIPSTYIVCTNDQGPPPQYQEMFGQASQSTIIRLESGHSPMLSKTEELAGLIDSAIEKAT
ncbi:alpha/beta-hydrolase [Nemania sp. FL0916]|nr:alpha/beta-hydrolase [Nemania sp. FL0916]